MERHIRGKCAVARNATEQESAQLWDARLGELRARAPPPDWLDPLEGELMASPPRHYYATRARGSVLEEGDAEGEMGGAAYEEGDAEEAAVAGDEGLVEEGGVEHAEEAEWGQPGVEDSAAVPVS